MAHGRAKRPHQKVKTGCMTCRKRRIKCDEGKPACRQCTDSLRKCEGYQPLQTWFFTPRKSIDAKDDASDDSRTTSASALTSTSTVTSTSASTFTSSPPTTMVRFVSPLRRIGNSKDVRSFQFWHEQAAPIFSSYFGHSFWTDLLPKMSFDQPAVKHLLLATSSLVESATIEGIPVAQNPIYQAHYAKAIQATSATLQVESVLLACLLFANCEFMKGSIGLGLQHIQAGLKIITEWVKTSDDPAVQLSHGGNLITQTIGPILLAYIDKAPTYGVGDVPVHECVCTTIINGDAELPCVEKFTEIHRALHALDGVGHHIARLLDFRRPAWTPSPPHKVQALLESWRLHFDTFEAGLTDTRRMRYAPTLQLLRVHHTMLSLMLRASSSKHESVYEKFGEEFQWIIDRYDAFAAAWARDESSKFFNAYLNVEYHMGYIPPLFFTATKCRDPAIRLAALKHLGSLRVVESNWTSCTAYLIARKMFKIEYTRAISGKRDSLRDERNLIRPAEALIKDKHSNQIGLNYLVYPYDLSPVRQETIDLQSCPAASSVKWPLSRIIRIGGFQGGAARPAPTNCSCQLYCPTETSLLRPKMKVED